MARAFNKLPAGAHRPTYPCRAIYSAYYIHTYTSSYSVASFSNINITDLKSRGLPPLLAAFLPSLHSRVITYMYSVSFSLVLFEKFVTSPGSSPSLSRTAEGDSHYNRTRIMASVRRKSTNNIWRLDTKIII